MKHTATPWVVMGLEIMAQLDNDHIATVHSKHSTHYDKHLGRKAKPPISNEANAAYIVKAVNAHEALVEAASLIMEQYNSVDTFVLGGNLTNEGFIALGAALSLAREV